MAQKFYNPITDLYGIEVDPADDNWLDFVAEDADTLKTGVTETDDEKWLITLAASTEGTYLGFNVANRTQDEFTNVTFTGNPANTIQMIANNRHIILGDKSSATNTDVGRICGDGSQMGQHLYFFNCIFDLQRVPQGTQNPALAHSHELAEITSPTDASNKMSDSSMNFYGCTFLNAIGTDDTSNSGGGIFAGSNQWRMVLGAGQTFGCDMLYTTRTPYRGNHSVRTGAQIRDFNMDGSTIAIYSGGPIEGFRGAQLVLSHELAEFSNVNMVSVYPNQSVGEFRYDRYNSVNQAVQTNETNPRILRQSASNQVAIFNSPFVDVTPDNSFIFTTNNTSGGRAITAATWQPTVYKDGLLSDPREDTEILMTTNINFGTAGTSQTMDFIRNTPGNDATAVDEDAVLPTFNYTYGTNANGKITGIFDPISG